jgi:hypothetical protein
MRKTDTNPLYGTLNGLMKNITMEYFEIKMYVKENASRSSLVWVKTLLVVSPNSTV